MGKIDSVCVYCGANDGRDPHYRAAATELGKVFAESGIRLVYGGGSVGLMGAVADSVLAHGGQVTGIIPEFLARREVMHKGVTDLIVTQDMHERKRLMFEHAEAFVALPGGVGTLEELIEMLTWAQLGRHKKPVVLANINNFWTHLVALIDHMREFGFVPSDRKVAYLEAQEIAQIVPMLEAAARGISEEELNRDAREGIVARM